MPNSTDDMPTGVHPAAPVTAGRVESLATSSDVTVHADLCGLSDRGLKRSNNEDHFLVARLDRTWHTLLTNVDTNALPLSATETVYGMVVADGMGGHAGGEVASATAISAFVDLVLRTPNLIMRLNRDFTEAALKRLAQRFEFVKEALEEAVRKDPSLSGMGTTLTLACSFRAYLLVAHVGDSRAYLFRNGQLQHLTRDQTMGQFLKETGHLTETQLAKHPLRHVLTGVLGTQGSPIDVDLRGVRLEDGDQVLLCTDGLTEMVSDSEIASILSGSPASSASACDRLVKLAIEHGGRDNVTVVLAKYRITRN